MEPAILAIHDFAPTVVGPTEPDRAATASAHDDTRSQDHPQLHQQAQNVLSINTRSCFSTARSSDAPGHGGESEVVAGKT